MESKTKDESGEYQNKSDSSEEEEVDPLDSFMASIEVNISDDHRQELNWPRLTGWNLKKKAKKDLESMGKKTAGKKEEKYDSSAEQDCISSWFLDLYFNFIEAQGTTLKLRMTRSLSSVG